MPQLSQFGFGQFFAQVSDYLPVSGSLGPQLQLLKYNTPGMCRKILCFLYGVIN